jgi:RNA polymerase sigma-70 factor (ECF subfamily)
MSDERSLIRRCKQRDEAALADLIRLKREKVFRVALNIVGDEDDAKDIAQMAFVRLWQAIGSFKESRRFDPWLFRIVVNLSLDHYRRTRRAAALHLEDSGPEPGPPPGAMGSVQDAALHRADIRRIFNEAARRLSPQQRAAFSLREIEGLSTEDAARVMGVRAATVRNHVFQARRVLQEYLRRRYPEIAGSRG